MESWFSLIHLEFRIKDIHLLTELSELLNSSTSSQTLYHNTALISCIVVASAATYDIHLQLNSDTLIRQVTPSEQVSRTASRGS